MDEKTLNKNLKELKPQDQYTGSKLRAMCREGFEHSIDHIAGIARGDIAEAPHAVRVRAHEVLRKCALGETPNYVIDHQDWLFTFCRITAPYVEKQEKIDDWIAQPLRHIRI